MTIQVLDPLVPGDDYPIQFTFTNSDGSVESQAGNSILTMVKADPNDADSAALSNFTTNASAPDQTNGIIKVNLPRAETRSYPQGASVYIQCRRIASGIYRTVLIGQIPTENSVIDNT